MSPFPNGGAGVSPQSSACSILPGSFKSIIISSGQLLSSSEHPQERMAIITTKKMIILSLKNSFIVKY